MSGHEKKTGDFQSDDLITIVSDKQRGTARVLEVDPEREILRVQLHPGGDAIVEVPFSNARLLDRHKPRFRRFFEPGMLVRVLDGPFADFKAIVESVDREEEKLKANVLIFGRSTPAELNFSQVEPEG